MRRLGPTALLLAAVFCALWFLLSDGPSSDGPSHVGSLLGENSHEGALLGADQHEEPGRATGPAVLEAGPMRSTSDPLAADLQLTGRVVDARRRPIAGAVVTLERGAGRARSATTDAAGGYALSLRAGAGAMQRATLVGRAEKGAVGDDRIGTAVVWLPPGGGALLAPTLVLEAGVLLDLRVVRDGTPVPGAQVAVTRRLSGALVVLAKRRTDAEGRLRVNSLPAGALEIFAAAPGSGRGHVATTLPRPVGAPVEILLGAERQIEVLVVDAATETPIAGAEVLPGDALTMPDPHGPGYLPFARSLRTDRSGRARIVGIPTDGKLHVNARAPGYALTPWWQGQRRNGGPGAPGGAQVLPSEVRIALSRYRVVTFPVSAEGAVVPTDSTELRVQITGAGRRIAGGDLAAVMRDGAIEIRGLPNRPVGGVVMTPAGAHGLFHAPTGAEVGSVVRFHAVRDVRVRVVAADGGVLPDVPLRLDPLGKGADIPTARTDAQGIAHFVGVGADIVAVRLVVRDQPSVGALLGKLDLKRDEEVYEVRLQRRVSVLVAVRIGGDARLPAHYTLMVGSQRVGLADLEEDPERGRLRAWVRPPLVAGALEIALHARGFLSVHASVELSAEVEAEVTLELAAAGSLVAVVTPPEDGMYSVGLQRLDPAGQGWQAAPHGGADLSAQLLGPGGSRGAGGEQIFEGLAPGRYRVIDARSGSVSAEVVVEPGRAAARVQLDLGAAIWLEGHVRAPAGSNLALARVLVGGRDEPGNIWAGARADAAGAFRVRARRGEPLPLRVTHPTLSPARIGGRVTVRPGAGEVELRLEAAAQTRFRLVGFEDAQTPASGAWYAPLRILLFSGAGQEPARVLQPVAEAGLFYFGGFDPGTYRLLLVFGTTYAPLSIPKAALGDTLTDLGTLTPSLGETLLVHWSNELPEGAGIWATATHVGEPAYTRRATHDKAAGELRCSGLGAGTFRVQVRGVNLVPGSNRSSPLLDKRIVIDGKGETVLDVSWR